MSAARNAKRAIVNADDFGSSGGVTEGVRRAHREGIATSTTITANMPATAAAVGAECDAQVRWAPERHGRPTHLDGHRHLRALPPLFARVARLARRYDIRFVRRRREPLPGRASRRSSRIRREEERH